MEDANYREMDKKNFENRSHYKVVPPPLTIYIFFQISFMFLSIEMK